MKQVLAMSKPEWFRQPWHEVLKGNLTSSLYHLWLTDPGHSRIRVWTKDVSEFAGLLVTKGCLIKRDITTSFLE